MSRAYGCTRRKHVWLVGEPSRHEFQMITTWLSQNAELRVFRSPRAAAEDGNAGASRDNVAPDVIILAQSRPGQWRSSEIESLHRIWPLARLAALVGSWCEGELRTGRPWSGVPRIYWHEFLLRIAPLLAGEDDGGAGWSLPRTASWSERMVGSLGAPVIRTDRAHAPGAPNRRKPAGTRTKEDSIPQGRPRRDRSQAIAVITPLRDVYEPLADACVHAGWVAEWHRSSRFTSRPAAAIWDMRWGDDAEWDEIGDLVYRVTPAKVVLIQGFPRWNDQARALRLGVSELIAKPYQIADLWRALRAAIGLTSPSGRPVESLQASNHSTLGSPTDYNHQEGSNDALGGPELGHKV